MDTNNTGYLPSSEEKPPLHNPSAPQSDPPPYPAQPTYGAQPAQYGAHLSQYGAHPSHYSAQPTAYGAHPTSYDAHLPQYDAHPAAYGTQPSPYPNQAAVGAGYSASANTVVVTQPVGIGYVTGVYPNNTGAIIFSCFVTWCCCCVLGIIAFVFAVTANSAPTGHEAHQKIRTSTRLSIAGVITGVLLYVVFTAIRITLQATLG